MIAATAPESHYVLDGQTDLPTFEHVTDTRGATLANFVLFDLVGKQLSPRIRDLGKITLYRTGPRADFLDRYPRAGALLNLDLITNMWDDLLKSGPGLWSPSRVWFVEAVEPAVQQSGLNRFQPVGAGEGELGA